jgi:predicted enzyme related to lactoylglutathione lyase
LGLPLLVIGCRRFLMPHGKICYLEIPANTAEASAAFYSRIFGWKVRERGDGNLAVGNDFGLYEEPKP